MFQFSSSHVFPAQIVWTDEVNAAYEELTKGIKAAKNASSEIKLGRKVAAQEKMKADGVDPDEVRNEHVDPYEPVKIGRKLYCRIDRQIGVTANTYKMYLETVTTDEADEEVDQFREEFMFAAVKKKTSLSTNYHVYDSEFLQGKYCGKIRGLSGMMDRDKKFEIFDSGKTAHADRSAIRRAGNNVGGAVASAPKNVAKAAYHAPGAAARGTVKAGTAVASGASVAAEATAVGAKKTVKMVKRGSAAIAKGTRNSLAGAANMVNNMQYSADISKNSKPGEGSPTEEEEPADDGANPMLSGKGKLVPQISKLEQGEEDAERAAEYKATDLVQAGEHNTDIVKAEARDGETIFQEQEAEEAADASLRAEMGYVGVTASDNLNRVLLLCHRRDNMALQQNSLLEAYNENHENTFHLRNKQAVWNETTSLWSLGFEGIDRVVLPSSKNFVFENDVDNQVYLQFGKKYANAFTLDFRYPMTPYHAFCFAMTFFEL
jgi:hypothetical protein